MKLSEIKKYFNSTLNLTSSDLKLNYVRFFLTDSINLINLNIVIQGLKQLNTYEESELGVSLNFKFSENEIEYSSIPLAIKMFNRFRLVKLISRSFFTKFSSVHH
jgi:vacuolar-type H+-ATPase subunit C/Vma6